MGKKRIVLADDDVATRLTLTRILEKRSYEVRAFGDGKSAFEAIVIDQPDLIILDLHMPHMNGRETIEVLKSDIATRSIPVIMLTSEAGIDEKAHLFESGAQDYLTKPCDPRELIARVDSHLHWLQVHTSEGGDTAVSHLANAVMPMLWTVDETGTVRFANAATTAYTGYTPEDLALHGIAHLLHPDDVITAETAWHRSVSAMIPLDVALRFKRREDDAFRWHAVRISPPSTERGTPREWIYSSTETHDARVAEGTRTMLDGVRQMLAVCDTDGFVEYVNSRWTEFTGLRLRTCRGLEWLDAVHSEDKILALRHVRASQSLPEADCELRILSRDGRYRWFLARTAVLNENTLSPRKLLTLIDIDELKQSQHALIDSYRRQKTITDTLKKAFVPSPMPCVPGIRIDTMYAPVNQDVLVGGDWFDVIPLPDGRIFFCVGDVAGHGVDAALVMVRARQSMLTLAVLENDPATLLQRVNHSLSMQDPKIVSALCGYIDRSKQSLAFAVAGHPPPIVAHKGRAAHAFACSGIGLGIWPDLETTTHRLALAVGSTFVAYTDGATEYGRDVIEGERRLIEATQRAIDDNDGDIAASIRRQILHQSSAGDDTTIVAITFD